MAYYPAPLKRNVFNKTDFPTSQLILGNLNLGLPVLATVSQTWAPNSSQLELIPSQLSDGVYFFSFTSVGSSTVTGTVWVQKGNNQFFPVSPIGHISISEPFGQANTQYLEFTSANVTAHNTDSVSASTTTVIYQFS